MKRSIADGAPQAIRTQPGEEQTRPPHGGPPQPPVPPPGGERGGDSTVAYRPIVTAHDLCVKAFSATRLRPGYSMVGVDALLDWAAAELRRLHAIVRVVENGGTPEPAELVPRIAPTEIRSTRFNTTRFFSGYHESEVGDFLRIVEREFANLHRFFSAVSAAASAGAPCDDDRWAAARHRGGPGSFHPGTTGTEVTAKTFTRTRFRAGYDTAQVDAFLGRVGRELDRLQAMAESARDGHPADTASVTADLTPQDIVNARFDSTWLTGGYSEYEVDDFLDFLEHEITRVQAYLS
ncbi:DivIVA domain protein [Candidatus Protofrankia datiscae]|uniref:Cell wall synthesis protein Wag31 n=1 Tax=Candidatus Protofrankia datiscae TaxID=2716812 RepID=F8AUW6_9ACTN|nr:DivIVA domain protein [Candidatus Protofrankia datiscae]